MFETFNRLFNKGYSCFKGILFLTNMFFIFGTEFLIYCILKDFPNFIEGLAIRLSRVNILCVKVFQAFALNNSLIDEKINNKLLQFTDNTPWDYSDIDLYELIEISDKYNLILKDGFEKPINSGMISLVFKATRRDNFMSPVIIKMKRKNIEEKLNNAIDNLSFLMCLLSLIPIVKKYKIAEVIDKNIEIIRQQTNFLDEVDNMALIKNNCKHLKYVKIPSANREVTEEYPNCIIMDYIEGKKINQINKEDYEDFAKQVIKFGFVTTIVHGVTHGDLHGGNILFIKDEKDKKYPHKIGVIDFGIIYEINYQYKSFLFDGLTQMFQDEPRESAIKILNSCIIDPPGILQQIPKEDYENIVNFTSEIIYETVNSSKKANQFQIYKFISKLNDYLSNSVLSNIDIRLNDNFVKTHLVLAMSHGVTLTLCNDDFMTLADKVINELFHTNMIID
jgi:predicted unusual protein kinase regulating ubiquinone biosynthesis (AarF/ABC1/UbiB family)